MESILSRIETDVLNNFKVLGVSAHPLSGYERLKVLHGVFHPAGEPFSFSYDWLTPTGLTTKDFIAPSSFKFGEGRYFAMGKKTGAVSFLEILAPELNDRILADIFCIQSHDFFKICDITSTAYLPHTGNSWFDGDSGSVMQFIF